MDIVKRIQEACLLDPNLHDLTCEDVQKLVDEIVKTERERILWRINNVWVYGEMANIDHVVDIVENK